MSGPPEPLVEGSDVPLATRHDVALLDLDGVLYVGPDAVPGAPEAVIAASRAGLRPAYVTNNASRTPETVAEHLRRLGLPARAEDVVTSAQAAATLAADRLPAGAEVLVVGGEGLQVAVRERGLVPVHEAGDGVAAVLQGFSPDVGWRLLAEGTYAVAAGLPWIATNMDATVPTPRGAAPGNGALVRLIAQAAGREPDAVAGKPERPLHHESVRRTGARNPVVVGDRMDTDIEGANRAGVPSLLVLTGVTRPLRPAPRCAGAASDLPGARSARWPAGAASRRGNRRGGMAMPRVDGGRRRCGRVGRGVRRPGRRAAGAGRGMVARPGRGRSAAA